MTINELRLAVAENPELLQLVNQLQLNQTRLNRLLFDLSRLDEALVQRVLMFQSIKAPNNSPVKDIADNCTHLLMTISSFINMAVTPSENRVADAATVYNDLMKRVMEK